MYQTRYYPDIGIEIEESGKSDKKLEDTNENCGGNKEADNVPYGEGYQDDIMDDSNSISESDEELNYTH